MTKLEGEFCPICGRKNWCYDRCNYCHEQLNKGWLNRDGIQVINPRTNRPIPHDMYNQPHQSCMRNGTGGKWIKNGVINEGSGMHEFMRRHAKLEGKDWVLYIDDRRTGLVVDREPEI